MSTQIPRRARSVPRHRQLPLVALLVTAGIFILIGGGWSPSHEAAAEASVDGIQIDTDISGNSSSILGPLDRCSSIGLGESLNVDIVIGPQGIPSDHPAVAFSFPLRYDPSILHVTAFDPNFLLASIDGSSILDLSNPVPDSDGLFDAIVLDFGVEGTAETGLGVLSRITFTAVGPGTSELTIDLSWSEIIDQMGDELVTDKMTPAVITVGQPCGDADGDTVPDFIDNCVTTVNPGQEDFDADHVGDACDTDSDNDGIVESQDLCPRTFAGLPIDSHGCATFQVDWDWDGVCDPAAPSGGPSGCTGSDNCPSYSNPGQEDLDGDGIGDTCDLDADGDRISRSVERSYESSDLDPLSTPEALKYDPVTCSDGVDNDRDTFTDSDDSYCPPPNDNFAGAFEILSFPYTDNHSNKTAGLEPGEPLGCDSSVQSTIWYKFTATEETRIAIVAGTHDGFSMATYTGTSLGNLEMIACDPSNPYFFGVISGGTTVYFQVGTRSFGQTFVNFRAWRDSDFDGNVDQFDNCPAVANPDQRDTDYDGIGDACDPTPTHDLALAHFSVSSGNLNVRRGDSFTLNIAIEVTNLKPWPETADVEIWLGSSPGYCALESLQGGSGLLIPPNGTTSAAIKATFACHNAVLGRYPITVAGEVYPPNGDTNILNNFGDDWTTLNIR